MRPPGNSRLGVGVEALMGAGMFANPDLQAHWDPVVLEQCQSVGMRALIKTIKMASPKPRYVKIVQGTKEPFLQFVEKIAAALEKQIKNEELRNMLCKQLAKDNANEDCRKMILSQRIPH